MSGEDLFWDESPYAADAVEYKKEVQEDMLIQLMEEMGFTDHYIAHSLDIFRETFE